MAKPAASSPAPAEITIPSFLQPAAIQADITQFGPFVISMVSSATKSAIHDVAEGLLELSEGTVTAAEVETLLADAKVTVPTEDLPIFGLLLNVAVAGINMAIAKFGADAPEVIEYLEDVSQGVLSAGF